VDPAVRSSPDRYRFAEFTLSIRQRQLFRNGRVLPLIPRYFDLLVLLIERRPTAVSRTEIFDRVWTDVVVSDGALSQAIRTLRRTLGDDSRESIFIRTVSRHGYSFLFTDVVEESEAAPPLEKALSASSTTLPKASVDEIDVLIDRLLTADDTWTDEDRRDAAEQLHVLGTAAALARLNTRPHPGRGLALLRDTRWNVEGAGEVPLLGQPGGMTAAWQLIRLRVRDAFILAERRSISAALGAAFAGAVAGLLGGLLMARSPASDAPFTIVPVFGLLGAISGAIGAAGIAAGVGAAEAVARSLRSLAIIAGAALGGLGIGVIAQVATRWTLRGLFGLELAEIGGPIEGLLLGAAAGFGYAATTRRPGGGGMATPSGSARARTVIAVGVSTAIAGLILSITGHPMVGGLINEIAQASGGSQLTRTPLADLYNDPSFGGGTKVMLAIFESGLFGLGFAAGFTRRPRH
jgi:DNA-binding winged helix-turn-helix (wHTH) protein